MEASVLALIQLILTPHVGSTTIKSLLQQELSLSEILRSDSKSLKKLGILNERQITNILNPSFDLLKFEKIINYIEKSNIKVIQYTDAAYPTLLKECNDAPAYLFYKGSAPLNFSKKLAIVGTRNNTQYGRTVLANILKELKNLEDFVIISGLAAGIDGIAHQSALDHNIPTIGVMGNGHDMIYPEVHQSLAIAMQANGGLLTEYLPFTTPEKGNFPMRNRIIAGMADMTLVVESAQKGGSMISAYLANDYNRTVGAIPGEIYKTASQGCNELIRKNVANIITCAQDIIDLMNWNGPKVSRQSQLFLDLNEHEKKVLSHLSLETPIYIDHLQQISGYNQSRLAEILLSLELNDLVISKPGKYYLLR